MNRAPLEALRHGVSSGSFVRRVPGLALALVAACSGSVQAPDGPGLGTAVGARAPGSPDEAAPTPGGIETGQAPLVCPDLGRVGAPVPMRRLTQRQVRRSVRDILAVDEELSVSDERIQTFASNISTAIDANGARAYYDFAERVAAKTELRRCSSAAACLSWLLDEIGPRLFRHPLSAEQRARYEALYKQGEPDGARWVLAALLQSPSFLYLDEAEGGDGYLDAYATAARLSLVLWGQNPDAALLARAAKGELNTPEALQSEAARMLADARSAGGVEDFVEQWLELRRLDDPDARPDLAALGRPVLDALRLEPVRFFQRLLAQKQGFAALLTSTESVRLDALLPLYASDVQSMSADGLQLDPTRRGGILTLPGVMAAHAHASSTSPTLRGYNVLAHFLCAPPPPPPANVSASLPEVAPDATPRERLEAHFSDDTCGACHRNMDGVGFAFEGLDWLGRTRREDTHGRAVDARARLNLAGKQLNVDGAVELVTALSELDGVAACVAKQWARYATGIQETADSRCLMQELGTQVEARDGLNQMMLTYLGSDWFRRGRGAP